MNTLIVAADRHHADNLRRQIPAGRSDVRIVSPGDRVGSVRYDLILITDYYERSFFFFEESAKSVAKRWLNELVLTRRSADGLVLSI